MEVKLNEGLYLQDSKVFEVKEISMDDIPEGIKFEVPEFKHESRDSVESMGISLDLLFTKIEDYMLLEEEKAARKGRLIVKEGKAVGHSMRVSEAVESLLTSGLFTLGEIGFLAVQYLEYMVEKTEGTPKCLCNSHIKLRRAGLSKFGDELLAIRDAVFRVHLAPYDTRLELLQDIQKDVDALVVDFKVKLALIKDTLPEEVKEVEDGLEQLKTFIGETIEEFIRRDGEEEVEDV